MADSSLFSDAWRWARWLALLGLLTLGSGCGFQPRGQSGTTAQLTGSVTVIGESTFSPFYRALRRAVQNAGGEWVDNEAGADSLIRVQRRENDSRVLSVDSRNRAIEYELEATVRFTLRFGADGTPTPAQTIRVVRTQFRPPDATLAAGRERTLLRQEMLDDLAERIVRRIAAQG